MHFKNFDKYRSNSICPDRHKILFETKGMYNDFLNAYAYDCFYCYRNYVKKNKVFCLSGEALSIVNAKPFLDPLYYPNECRELEYYNDRYGDNLNNLS